MQTGSLHAPLPSVTTVLYTAFKYQATCQSIATESLRGRQADSRCTCGAAGAACLPVH